MGCGSAQRGRGSIAARRSFANRGPTGGNGPAAPGGDAFTLDTNAVIHYLAGDPRAVAAVREAFAGGDPVYVSTIPEAELLSFRRLTEADARLINDLMGTVSLIPVDSQVARIGAAVRRAHRPPLPDSLIAATALFTGSTLITRNTRDSRDVASLEVPEI